jgi:hypothetical protein
VIETIRIDGRKLFLVRRYDWIVACGIAILAVPPIANVPVGDVYARVAVLIVVCCCRVAFARVVDIAYAIKNTCEEIYLA